MERMENYMVGISEEITRVAVMVEQYNELDTSLAQLEMQSEVITKTYKNTPGAANNQDLVTAMHQADKGRKYFLNSKTSLLELIDEVYGMTIDELKEELLILRILQERYFSLHSETKKLETSFDIIAEANAFDPDPNAEDSRENFESTLNVTRSEQDIAQQKLSNRIYNLKTKLKIVTVSGNLNAALSVQG